MRIDDNWCEKALAVLEGVNANGLITSLSRTYSYEDVKGFDFIASVTTGTDHIDNRDIPLLSLKGEAGLKNIHATSEHTFALILSLVRRIPAAFEDVKQGNWNRDAWQGSELRHKNLGIIGYGRVGQQVARIAEGFGMYYSYYDPAQHQWNTIAWFEKVLRWADIITVHVPLDDTTRNMFGCEQFKMMKKSAYFINTSRGAVVQEHALIWALIEKEIAGAALDVVGNEPDIDPSLKQYINWPDKSNLIITPHIAGNTAESREKTQMMLAEKITAYVNSRAVPTEEDICHSHRKAGLCDGVL